MTAEYLLNAIGQIDDDLILDAQLPAKRPSRLPRQLASWAAALLLCAGLGSLFFWRTGSGGSSQAPATPFPSTPAAPMEPATPSAPSTPMAPGTSDTESVKPGASSPSASPALPPSESQVVQRGFCVKITLDGLTYSYSHFYPETQSHGTMVDQLPEGCRFVARLESLRDNPDITIPHTDIGVYTGCALWLLGSGQDSTLYLELPEGGYLVCEFPRVYDFSPGGRG